METLIMRLLGLSLIWVAVAGCSGGTAAPPSTPGTSIRVGKSFADAVADAPTPPIQKSITNMPIADKLKLKVAELWSSIRFVNDQGERVRYRATINTDFGKVTLEFFPDDAPSHARSFIALAKLGFYDGLLFHRVIDGFMIQGGCPAGNGTAGPGYALKAEFNQHPHVAGTVSAARAGDPDSAGSQFFICLNAVPDLDNQYTAFGKVIAGMDAVERIAKVPCEMAGESMPSKPKRAIRIRKVDITETVEG